MRKLASIQTIVEILPIPDADAIEKARVNNWWVVVKKGDFVVGDNVIYCEIDSWIPTTLAPFLSKDKEPNVYKGIQGELLRTVRMRKTLSQGLILPISLLGDWSGKVGDDVTSRLGIIKWEQVIPDEMEGARGWPSFIPKTDEERIQNIPTIFEDQGLQTFDATIKVDGQSATFFFGGPRPRFGCCTRNYEIKRPTWWRTLFARLKRLVKFRRYKKKPTVWDIAKKYNLEKVLSKLDRQYAFQGEMYGEGIEKNPEQIKGRKWVVFNIYDIQEGQYLGSVDRDALIAKINSMLAEILKGEPFEPITAVPVLETFVLGEKFKTVDEILSYAEGPSLNPTTKREGIVFKRADGRFSFKAIANSYLIGK